MTIRLTRGATLSGTVKTSIGSGVRDLEVRVGYLKSAIPFQPISSAIGGIFRTDAAGRFTIKRLPLGLPFRIEIAANNAVVGWSDRITLTSSDAVTPVAIVVRPMVSLNGSVGDLNGVAVKGAAITAWVRPNGRNDYAFEAPSVTRTESDADGRFMLQIPRDTQALIRASVRGYVDATTIADVSAESEDARALQLTLARIP